MPITLVGNSAAGGSYAATRQQPFTSTAGNALVLVVLHQGQAITSVTDTAGNTWTLAADSASVGAPSQYQVAVYYCLNAKAITSVTVTCPATTAIVTNVSQWAGVGGFRGGAAKYAATGGAQPAPSAVAVQAGDVLVGGGAYYAAAQGETVAAPFVQMNDAGVSTTQLAVAYDVADTAGTVGPVWTQPDGTKPFGSATVALSPAGTTATVTVTTAGETTTATYSTAPTTPPVIVDPDDRPTGAGYVSFESLNVTTLREAVQKAGLSSTPVKLTLPGGTPIPLGPDWNAGKNSVVNVPAKVIGIVGGKNNPAILEFPDVFSPYNGGITDTNPWHTIAATAGTIEELSYLIMRGNGGQLHNGLRVQNETKRPVLTGIQQINAAPGDYWSNPNETFGINLYRCLVGITVNDYYADGEDNMASPLGFNSSNNIIVRNLHTKRHKYGMPTIWCGTNADIYDPWVEGGHIIWNLENVGGTINIYRPRGTVFRGTYTAGPGAGKTGASSAHLTFQSNRPAYVADALNVYDAEFDQGLHNYAPFLMMSDPYTVDGGSGIDQLQHADRVHFYYGKDAAGNPIPLKPQDYAVAGAKDPGDKTKNFFIHH